MSAPVAEIPAPVEVNPTPLANEAVAAPTLEGGAASLEGGKKRGRKRMFVRETRRSRKSKCPCRNIKQSPRRMSGGGMYGMYGSPRRGMGMGRYGMMGGEASASPSLSGGKRRYVRETRRSRLRKHPRCTCRTLGTR
jgi:hypothetical protein